MTINKSCSAQWRLEASWRSTPSHHLFVDGSSLTHPYFGFTWFTVHFSRKLPIFLITNKTTTSVSFSTWLAQRRPSTALCASSFRSSILDEMSWDAKRMYIEYMYAYLYIYIDICIIGTNSFAHLDITEQMCAPILDLKNHYCFNIRSNRSTRRHLPRGFKPVWVV